jgi:transcriptional regulator with XRE-family HTH domain
MTSSQPLTPLARKLREALAVRGLKQADVIRLMPEVSPAIIGHWFNGRRQPQLDNLRRLAEILEVSAASLVADEPDYAHTTEEKLALQLMRSASPEVRQAVLAVLQAKRG